MNVRKKIVIGVGIVFVCLLLLFIPIYRVYSVQADDTFTRVAFGFLPAASVEGVRLPYREFLMHLDAQKVFVTSPLADLTNGAPTMQQMRKEAMQRALRIRLMEKWSAREGITFTTEDVDRSYTALVERAGTSTQAGEIQQVMKDLFGWDEPDFKRNMIRPALMEEALSAKFEAQGKSPEQFQAEIDSALQQAKIYLTL